MFPHLQSEDNHICLIGLVGGLKCSSGTCKVATVCFSFVFVFFKLSSFGETVVEGKNIMTVVECGPADRILKPKDPIALR